MACQTIKPACQPFTLCKACIVTVRWRCWGFRDTLSHRLASCTLSCGCSPTSSRRSPPGPEIHGHQVVESRHGSGWAGNGAAMYMYMATHRNSRSTKGSLPLGSLAQHRRSHRHAACRCPPVPGRCRATRRPAHTRPGVQARDCGQYAARAAPRRIGERTRV